MRLVTKQQRFVNTFAAIRLTHIRQKIRSRSVCHLAHNLPRVPYGIAQIFCLHCSHGIFLHPTQGLQETWG